MAAILYNIEYLLTAFSSNYIFVVGLFSDCSCIPVIVFLTYCDIVRGVSINCDFIIYCFRDKIEL